jgi:hypothetical protein
MRCCCKLQETALLHDAVSHQLLLPALQEGHHHCCATAAAAWAALLLLLLPLPPHLQLCLALLLVVMLLLHGAAVLVRNLCRHAARCDWAGSDSAGRCHAAENHMHVSRIAWHGTSRKPIPNP